MEENAAPVSTHRPGMHDSFRIISGGRELPFPMFRILGLVAIGFLAGILVAS